MITNIDDNFGALMAKLKDWDLDRKTLVIFMTDNGHSIASVYNADMHGNKGTCYQGGTRVPAFWRWTGTLPDGVDCPSLTAAIDIFPTFAELAGATIPSDVKLDGRSLMPLLLDASAPWEDRYVFANTGRWPNGQSADYKYAKCSVRSARFRFVNNKELYDILNDPGETKNLIDEHPDVAAKMREAYDKWWDEVLPATKENEQAVGPEINPFKELYWQQFGKPTKS
jgi:arylsulfatase